MSIFETFATDPKAEAEGKWFNFPKNKDGTTPGFLLARMSRTNPRYQSAVERVSKEFKTEIKFGVLTEDLAFEPFLEVFADTVLLNWRNVQDRDNKEIPYTKDTAIKLMKELPALYDVLREQANSMASYHAEEVKKALPN